MIKSRQEMIDRRKDTEILDPDWVRRQLPPIGHRMRMRLYNGHELDRNDPAWCEVVGGNYEKMWYRVRFSGSGIYECFKMP